MKELRKGLARMISLSLNGDQANYIAEQLDPRFNLHKLSGFSDSISVPAQVAADTIVEYFQSERDLIRYFELMMGREGVFLFNSTISIKGADEFIKILKKKRWIYDRDLKQFLRDPFYQESVNFLKTIEMLDLRQDINFAELTEQIKEHTNNVREMELEWQVTLRMYGMDQQRDQLMKNLIKFLLSKQNLESHTFNVYTCLKELAINAGKANYKHIFTQNNAADERTRAGYQDILEEFKAEIEEHGDRNLVELARRDDVFFDVIFKSNQFSFSIWVCNYIPIAPIEKERLVHRLNLNHFDTEETFDQKDDLMEGAGLGLNLVMKVLEHYGVQQEPIKAVFYPKSTKIGFVLNRSYMKEVAPTVKPAARS